MRSVSILRAQNDDQFYWIVDVKVGVVHRFYKDINMEYGVRLSIVLGLFKLVSTYPASSNSIQDDYEIDLSHLGARMYGPPSVEVGRRVEYYFQNSNYQWNPEELGSYVEGDILNPHPMGKNGVVEKSFRWPDGVIPFEIRGTFSAKDMQTIESAIEAYHKNTCIKFIPRRNTDRDYVSIQGGPSGCWSSIGRQGGQQIVNLQSPGCLIKVGTAIHELMHAVGFLHEQNREERDNFVSIVLNNVVPGTEVNFAKAPSGTANGFGVGYDYGSIMHYSTNAFSSNGGPTIVARKSTKALIGQREGFSKADKQKLWNMYNCRAATSSSGYRPDFASAIEAVPNLIGGFIDLIFSDAGDAEEMRQ